MLVEVPALALAAWWAIRRRSAVLATLLVVLVAGYALQPYRWWSRFGFVLIGAGAAAAGLALHRLDRHRAVRALSWALVPLAAVPVALVTWEVDTGTGRVLRASEVARLAVEPVAAHSAGRTFLVQARWVDCLRDGARIGVAIDERRDFFYFPLFGIGLDRTLVPLDATRPDELRRQVRSGRVDVVASVPGTDIDRMAAADDVRFRKVDDVPDEPGNTSRFTMVYEVAGRPPPLREGCPVDRRGA
jgi:hypothetical protein